jgi:hypothetical protein
VKYELTTHAKESLEKRSNIRATCKTAESEFIYGQIGQEKRKTPALK